jgi:glycosyltransferase involved in cell wall biosynthesis
MRSRVSVIVPVRNRRDLVLRLLDALDAQRYRDFEVIVVDDGSTDGTPDEVRARAAAGANIQLLHSGGVGAVGARRAGVTAASGEILAFTDSDCVPDPDWLAAGVAAVDDGAGLINGRTRPERDPWPLERTMASDDDGLYPTCNLLVTRSAFEAQGGFDEQAVQRLGFRLTPRLRGTGFGEDTLLAWRIRRGGVACRYAPDAVVAHHVFPPDLRESFSRALQAGAFPALVREVPELRATFLYHRIQLGPRSRVPFYLTVAALAARRPRLTLVTLVWWTWLRTRDLMRSPAPRARKVALLPVEMVLDAATGASLVAGSVRTRTPVI